MTRDTEVKAKEYFPITACGYTKGKLLDDTKCGILVDTGMSKSYMSQSYFMRGQELAFLTKIHFCHNESPSWQWTICRYFVHYTCHTDHPKS